MTKRISLTLLIVPSIFIPLLLSNVAEGHEYLYKEIPLQDEQSLDVKITFGSGELWLERAEEGTLLDGDFQYHPKRKEKPIVTYNVHDGKGFLVIKLEKEGNRRKDKDDDWGWWNWGDNDEHRNRWKVRLTDNIPISFEIEMGATKSDLDFTGLRVKRLDIETGASDTEIWFNKVNPEIMEKFDVDVGAAKFRASDLGNANFEHLSFNGGVGKYFLDFRGTTKRKAFVDISMGIGSLTLLIPEQIGTSIKAVETFLTGTSVEGFTKEGRSYKNRSYGKSEGEFSITIDQAIGSLRIKTVEE